jgi:hypothetical protein
VPESQRALRCRLWVAADGEVLGSYIPPAAFESVGAVLQVHVVRADAVEDVVASIGAGAYPADSPYIPVPLAGLNDDLLDNLPLVCRLGSADERESLAAWLELWMFIDEEGRTRTLAESLWEGQRRFLEALLRDGHVLSIKSRKVGLSTLVCAHAAWTARIRDVNASVHPALLSRGCGARAAAQPAPRLRGIAVVPAPAAGAGNVERALLCGRPCRFTHAEGVSGHADRVDRSDELAFGAR